MKNKGKRMISLLLVLVFVLSLSPVSFAAGAEEQGQEPAPGIQTSDAGGDQAQSGGAPTQGGQEALAAQAGSAGSAGVTQPAPAAESAAQTPPAAGSQEAPAAQAGSAESAGATQSAPTESAAQPAASLEGVVQTNPAAESATETVPVSQEPAVKTPANDAKQEAATEAADAEKAGGTQTPVTDAEASGTGTDDGKELSNPSSPDSAGDTVKIEQPGADQADRNQAEGNHAVEPASEEQQPENEAGKTPAEKTDQPDTKSEAPVAKAAVQATPAKANAPAKGADAGTGSGGDYVVTPKDGSVKSAEGSNTLRLTGNGSVEIELNNNVTESGKSIVIGSDDNSEEHNIIVTLKNVVVAAKEKLAGILVKANAKLTLLLSGESTVTGGDDHAGIEVEWTKDGDKPAEYGSLTIDGDGTLNATGGGGSGGAGIGGSKGGIDKTKKIDDKDYGTSANGTGVYGDITINGGTINATGTKESAGIGSSDNPMNGTSTGSYKHIEDRWGTITINGGNVTATGHARGAGIGGGNHSDSGLIVINDGTVNAAGHSGIGSGYGSHQTAVNAETGKHVKGPGYYFADVTINGGTIVATATSDGTTNAGGAGIGGGQYGDAKVTINGGNITATGGNGKGIESFHHGGAGIGGGYEGHSEVTITGGTITAIGGGAAAGIGSGSIPNTNENNGGTQGYKSRRGEPTYEKTDVEISGGNITALGGVSGGAGIGGGVGADNASVTITGGNVYATGGKGYPNSSSGNLVGEKGGAGIGSGYSGIDSGESSKYFSTTNVDVTIGGNADVTAIGGWGAAGIGSGAGNITAKSITIGGNAEVQAYSDGTKFAIDSRDGQAAISVLGDILQGTFVYPYKDQTGVDQDPSGLKSITLINDKTGEIKELTLMPENYRSFASTVSEAGTYTVYTDEKVNPDQIGGRYFGRGETEVRDPRFSLSETTRYTAKDNVLSDNYFLFPVKSIVVSKLVVAEDGLDKSSINTTCYFALWDRAANEYVRRNGEIWIESIDIVNGVPQSRAFFADVNDSPEGGYGVWEVDRNDPDRSIIGTVFGSYELLLIATEHEGTGDNDATITRDKWTDAVTVINTYVPVPDPDPDPTPDNPGIPEGPVPEEIDEDEVPLAAGSLTNQLGECFD